MTGEVSWTVEFYRDAKGSRPVRDFLDGLPAAEQAQFDRLVARLRAFGLALGPPYAQPVEGRLWELRPGPNRVFYFAYTGRRFVLLHAYRKKSRKAPRREIETALRRMDDYLGRRQG